MQTCKMMMWLKSDAEVEDKLSTLRPSTVRAQLRWSVRGTSALLRIGRYLIRSDRQRGDGQRQAVRGGTKTDCAVNGNNNKGCREW